MPQPEHLSLHLHYRPQTLDEVVGQKPVTDALFSLLSLEAPPHDYLFVGPKGCGKTSLARIVMTRMQCEITEIDAASNTGIDAMREIVQIMRYPGLTNKNRGLIIDEAHRLSAQAWDSLLKVMEEPPSHLYIALCTTVHGKVPATVVDRCHTFFVKSLKFDDLMDILEKVDKAEGLDLDAGILELVARSCDGSARRALVMLDSVAHCRNKQEAAALLESPEDDPEIIELARLLVSGRLTWSQAMATLRSTDLPAESIRIMLVTYIAAAMMKPGNVFDPDLLHMLRTFSQPCNPTDKMAPLLVAFGEYLR